LALVVVSTRGRRLVRPSRRAPPRLSSGARPSPRALAAAYPLRGSRRPAQRARGAALRVHGRHASRRARAFDHGGELVRRVDGAALYKPFANLHLEPLSCGDAGDEGIHLLVRTNQSRLHVAIAARTRASIDGERIRPKVERIEEKRYIAEEIDVALEQGRRLS